MSELVSLDRRAVEATLRIAERIGTDDSGRPTPCAGWTVADLMAHMTGQQLGFAAAARGAGQDLADWQPVDGDYAAACADVIAAFAEPGVDGRAFALPEIRSGGMFPAQQAISFHLVDNVVHAWDLATALGLLGLPVELDEDVLAAALAVAEQVPNGAERLRPGSAFAPARAIPANAGTLDRIVSLLGRQPTMRLATAQAASHLAAQ
jgi:uncharacterized protein (TIGR03086 family)